MRLISLEAAEALPDGADAAAAREGAHVPDVTWRTLLRDLNDLSTRLFRPAMEAQPHDEFVTRLARAQGKINAKAMEVWRVERAEDVEAWQLRHDPTPPLRLVGEMDGGRFWKVHRNQ